MARFLPQLSNQSAENTPWKFILTSVLLWVLASAVLAIWILWQVFGPSVFQKPQSITPAQNPAESFSPSPVSTQ